MFPQYDTNQMYQQMLQPILDQGKREVIRVNGKPGADAFQMGPNESALLLDTTQSMVWLAQTDGAGYKTLTPYDISPHVEVVPEDKFKALEDRITRLEEKIDAKSYTGTNDKRYRSEQRNDAGNRSHDERRVPATVHAELSKDKSSVTRS